MPWQPMSLEDAKQLLEALPPSGTTDHHGFGRMLEAWMVRDGAPSDRVRQALEAFHGRPLD